MTRTNSIRFVFAAALILAGCAAPVTTSPSGQPQNTDAGSAVVGATAAVIATVKEPPKEPEPAPSIDAQFTPGGASSPLPMLKADEPTDGSAPAVIPTSKPAKKASKKKKKSAAASAAAVEVGPGDTPSDTPAEEPVRTDSGHFTVKCIVRLPDDEEAHPELCRGFRIVLLDSDDNEIDRFRFDGDGMYRHAAEAGKTYHLKPLIADNWKFSISPRAELRGGDTARATFVQKH